MQSIQVVLSNVTTGDEIDYVIEPNDSLLAQDWQSALEDILLRGLHLEKNFCFLGFPKTQRTLDILCDELNYHIHRINTSDLSYRIEEHFTEHGVWFDTALYSFDRDPDHIKHDILNRLHNHFEILQGTVGNMSEYYVRATPEVKYSIRQLNNLCHEIESLVLSKIKHARNPHWIRPSQITTFLHAPRYHLKDEHRRGFITNGYDRVFGGVYMHWCQIGKTYFEVWRDEHAPDLTDTVCEAITDLEYYSGEFDIEWGRSITQHGDNPWHNRNLEEFLGWMIANGKDVTDPELSLGYLPLGQVNLVQSFGTAEPEKVWDILSNYLNIHSISINGKTLAFPYNWADQNYEHTQMQALGLRK